MSIVFVHASPFPRYSGGIENWLYNIINQTQSSDVEIVIICPKGTEEPFYDISGFTHLKIIESSRIQVNSKIYNRLKRMWSILAVFYIVSLQLLWTIRSFVLVRRFTNSGDVLIALQPVPAMLPILLSKMFGIKNKVICYFRGTLGNDLKELNRKTLARIYIGIEKFVVKYCDEIFSNGEDTSEYIQRSLGKRSLVIPNGVKFAEFANASVEKGNDWVCRIADFKKAGYRILMTVATVRDIKGIRYLIEAAEFLKESSNINFKVVFVGKGDPSEYLKYGEKLGVSEHLIFVGQQSDVPAFLQVADVAVAVSGGGGVSHAALEMMAAGRPIVAWNNQTYSQLISHGYSGHLVEDRDSAKLAEGLKAVLTDSEYLKTIAQNGQNVAANYDWREISRRFVDASMKVQKGKTSL